MNHSLKLCASIVGVSIVYLGVTGCTNNASQKALVQETSYLKPLSLIYGQMGRPPKDQEQFKQVVSRQMQSMFRAIEYDTVDELFISKRDGKPYVIFYGKRPKGVPKDMVGYEREGVGGKRLVGYALGNVEEVDEEEFRKLVPNPVE